MVGELPLMNGKPGAARWHPPAWSRSGLLAHGVLLQGCSS